MSIQRTLSRDYLCGAGLLYSEFQSFSQVLIKDNLEGPEAAMDHYAKLVAEYGYRDRIVTAALLQLKAFMFKAPDSRMGSKPRENAIKTFFQCEAKCKETNDVLFNNFRHHDYIKRARHLIYQVIGDFDDGVLADVLRLGHPGSGQALGYWNAHRHSTCYKYVAYDLTTTAKAARYAGSFTSILGDRPLIPVRGARLSFVPKDAKTFRSIAVEPNLNMYLQLGVHEWLAERLRDRAGQDIRDQSANQVLAYWGSVGGGISTVDFSNASDLISDSLVFSLLPRTWYNYLSEIKSSRLIFEGEEITLSKFSTMGNGFTFALETLIFWALARSVAHPTHTVSVYGDDVCISTDIVEEFLKISECVGLVPNRGKTFTTGHFRESCGTDWYAGENITPIKINHELSPRDCYRIINRWGRRPMGESIRAALRKYCKDKFNCWHLGLENEDDGSCVFVPETYLTKNKTKYSKRYQALRFKGLVEKAIPAKNEPELWLYFNALMGGSSDGPSTLYLKGRTSVRETFLSPGRKLVCDIYGATRPRYGENEMS